MTTDTARKPTTTEPTYVLGQDIEPGTVLAIWDHLPATLELDDPWGVLVVVVTRNSGDNPDRWAFSEHTLAGHVVAINGAPVEPFDWTVYAGAKEEVVTYGWMDPSDWSAAYACRAAGISV